MVTIEIERKYLLDARILSTARWTFGGIDASHLIHQAYLSTKPWDVRVRLEKEHHNPRKETTCTLTAKHGSGLVRTEVTAPLALEAGLAIYDKCHLRIVKTRFRRGRWEIDVYQSPHTGLVVAEIELTSEDEEVPTPDWMEGFVIAEVTHDARFKNGSLAQSSEDIWTTYTL